MILKKVKKISMNMPETLYEDLYKLYEEAAMERSYRLSYSFSEFIIDLCIKKVQEQSSQGELK